MLPQEIIVEILTRGNFKEATKMCSTNKRISEICKNNPNIWKPLLEKMKKVSDFKKKHDIVIGECKKNTLSHQLNGKIIYVL